MSISEQPVPNRKKHQGRLLTLKSDAIAMLPIQPKYKKQRYCHPRTPHRRCWVDTSKRPMLPKQMQLQKKTLPIQIANPTRS